MHKLQHWQTHLRFKYPPSSLNKSSMFPWKGGQVDTHVSYFMSKTLTDCESEVIAYVSVS